MASQDMAILRMQADSDRTKFHDARESDPSVPEDSPASNGTALERLLGKCLDDNNAALWAEFVHHSRPLIATIIAKYLRRVGTPRLSAADDLIQETYLKLCRNNFKALRNFVYRHEGSFYGFLKVVTRNVILDYIRDAICQKRGRSKVDSLDEKSIAKVVSWYGHTDVERKILLGTIDDFVAETTCKSDNRRDYAIFCLYYRLGLSTKLIARCPSINLTTKGVESAILRLTRQIRGRFNLKWDQRLACKGIRLRDAGQTRTGYRNKDIACDPPQAIRGVGSVSIASTSSLNAKLRRKENKMQDNKIVIITGDHTLEVNLTGTIAEVHCTRGNCFETPIPVPVDGQPSPVPAPPIHRIGATRDKDGNLALHLHLNNS